MIILVSFLVVLVSVPLCGGRLSRLASLEIRAGHLVLVSTILQTIIISVFHTQIPHALAQAVHLYSYVLALAFVWANRKIRGLTLLAIGAAANAAAIGANGGVMPASRWAQRTAGLVVEGGFANSDVVTHARLLIFGDIFAVPAGLPFANVFSVGDVLLVIGAGVIMHVATGSRLSPSTRRHDDDVPGERESSALATV
ncbi:MAG: DUF5317 family protein [Ilumatobacteraceae bacterium]